MFDFVRKHTKVMMFVMFLLIIPSFVLFGIDGYDRFRDKGEAVAIVNGHEISQGEWDFAHKQEVDRIRGSMPSVDPKLLDSPEARYATLERLVRERVMSEAVDKFHLQTSDAKLARELQQNPTIASLRRADGTLDMERYRQLAASQGLSPEGFEARVRKDMSISQVDGGIVRSGLVNAKLADVTLNAFFERREIQFVQMLPSDYIGQVNPTDAEIEGFYKDNQAMFKAPETAKVEFVVLDLESVKKGLVVNEADLKSYFEQNVSRLNGQQERRASHILINAPKTAPADDRVKARARAGELLTKARKAPETFPELAKANSQDSGSAVNGGDLDFFARGAMVKPFEDAAFAMKKGDISDVVESDFGFHIIKLTDIKDPVQKTFAELRGGIEADLKAQQAKAKFAETAEAFTNAVYEQSDSLKPVADKLKLQIQTADNLSRVAAPGAKGVLANAKLLDAIFNADAIEKKRNTEAIETGPSQLVAARVVQYTPASTIKLADVRVMVREKLVAQRGLALAKKDGADKLAQWKANPGAAVLPASVVIARDQPSTSVPGRVIEMALRADPTALPVLAGVDLGLLGYAVVKVNAVVPRVAPAEAKARQEREQYAQGWSSAESAAYYKMLKEQFKVQIKTAKPVRGAPGALAGSTGSPVQ